MELAGVYPYEELTEREVLEEAILNTDVIVENPDDAPQNWKIIGNAIDIALAKCAAMRGIIKKQVKLFEKIPFSHENKFAAIIYEAGGERMAILGAPEALLQKTGLSRQAKEEILKDVGRMASRGERILGVARGNPRDMGKSETWEFLGLVSFNDPVRKSVKGAIVRIGEAGVKTIIVTGDHQGTAEAVAREIGLIDGEGAVLTGEDLAHLNKEELKNITDKTTVFARVSPQDKFNLVNIFKEKGEVVAVTGDGVNDAPALKRADIGVALGSGTDVAKSVSDLVILDDNFETVVAAIEEGRRILKNIKKIIVYLLSDSANELFLIGGSMLMGLALPINALQILFVNFFSDSFPAIALAFEKDENELGKLNKDGHDIFDRKVKFLVLIIGALTSLLLFAIYYLMLRAGALPEIARTFIFASFAIYTLFLAFSAKNLEKNIWSYSPFSNKYLVAGSSIGILLTAAVIYIPTLQRIFQTVALSPLWLLGVLAVCFMNLLLVEASKWLFIKKIL